MPISTGVIPSAAVLQAERGISCGVPLPFPPRAFPNSLAGTRSLRDIDGAERVEWSLMAALAAEGKQFEVKSTFVDFNVPESIPSGRSLTLAPSTTAIPDQQLSPVDFLRFQMFRPEHFAEIAWVLRREARATRGPPLPQDGKVLVAPDNLQPAYKILSCAYPPAVNAASSSAMCSRPRVSMVISIVVSPRLTPW